MSTKKSVLNAGLKSWPENRSQNLSLLGRFLRAIFGALLVSFFWFLMGWALSSSSLGLILALWSFVVGPLLFPPLLWIGLRLSGQLKPLELGDDPILSDQFFKSILRQPGPNPRLWVRSSSDPVFLWLEASLFHPSSTQMLVLPSSWLSSDPSLKARDWNSLWKAIADSTLGERRLKTLQFCFWTAALLPLEVLVTFVRVLLDILAFHDLPELGLWLQRPCWSLRSLWFGVGHDIALLRVKESHFKPELPSVWNSLTLGTWFQLAYRNVHPLWPTLTHSEAFLEPSVDAD